MVVSWLIEQRAIRRPPPFNPLWLLFSSNCPRFMFIVFFVFYFIYSVTDEEAVVSSFALLLLHHLDCMSSTWWHWCLSLFHFIRLGGSSWKNVSIGFVVKSVVNPAYSSSCARWGWRRRWWWYSTELKGKNIEPKVCPLETVRIIINILMILGASTILILSFGVLIECRRVSFFAASMCSSDYWWLDNIESSSSPLSKWREAVILRQLEA